MQRPRHASFWLLLSRCLFSCAAAEQDRPWVRRYNCGYYLPKSATLSPFWISSFRGGLDTVDGSDTQLTLEILAVHNQSLISCDEIDVSMLEKSVEFQTLGHQVGQLHQFETTCPKPLTDATKLPGGHRFCSYHIVYSFPGTYQLQTFTSAPFRFQRTNGSELDCGLIKVTPYIGESVSAALTFTPLSVLALVAFSSWQTHLGSDAAPLSLGDHDHILVGQALLWAIVRDVTGYLRHLQFLFVSASMNVEYPGFYVPAVGKLAWANLLYWSGPMDSHYSYKGPHGGMYTSNSSYGLGYMTQMLQYPNMLDTLANSLINLALLVILTFFAVLLVLLKVSRPTESQSFTILSVAQRAAGITLGMALCFFSVPLLAYITYDLILIGYLPDYRIGLAVLMMLVIFGADYFLTRRIHGQLRYRYTPRYENDQVSPGGDLSGRHRLWETVSRHLPQSLPLVQAVGIGALQYYPVAQISILAGTEGILLLYGALKWDERPFALIEVLCSAARFLTALLNTAFFTSGSEGTKEWIGYSILGLHGLLVLPLVFINCTLELYRRFWSKGAPPGRRWDRSRDRSNLVAAVDLRNLQSRLPTSLEQPGNGRDEGPSARGSEQDPSSFYRVPRSQPLRLETMITQQELVSETVPVPCGSEADFDLDSALSQITPGRGVDYSMRESDLFYGVLDKGTSSTPAPAPDSASSSIAHSNGDGSNGIGLVDRWKAVSANLRWPRQKEQEKGFHVARPPRPPFNDSS